MFEEPEMIDWDKDKDIITYVVDVDIDYDYGPYDDEHQFLNFEHSFIED